MSQRGELLPGSVRGRARVAREALMTSIRRHPWLTAWLSLLPFIALRAGTFSESDTFWQIRTGLLTISERSIPSRDPFSWTAAGDPWTQNSWGFNVLLAVFYRLGGLPSVAIASMMLSAATLALALVLARRAGAHPFVTVVLLQAQCSVLLLYLQARPQIADYAAVLAIVLLADQIVRSVGRPWAALCWTAAIVVMWVNLHAAAPFGVAILGASAVLAVLHRPSRARAKWLLAATTVAAVAALVNPYGVGVYTQTFRVQDASTELIVEWQRLDVFSPLQTIFFLPGIVALVIALRRRDVVFSAALAVAAAGSVSAMRILPLLALTAFPILASAATKPAVLRYVASRKLMLTQGSVVFLTTVSVVGIVALTHAGRPDPKEYSPAVVDAIPSHCRMLNSYVYGGYLILERPDLRVSIDSRNDLYGVDRVREHIRTMKSRPGSAIADVDCVLISKSAPLATWLRTDPAWRVSAEARSATLFVRTS